MRRGTPSAFSILAGIVGDEKAAEVRDKMAGESVYIPHRAAHDPEELREAFERVIARAHSVTDAYESVAAAMDVSPRTVQRAVTRAKLL